MKPFVTVLLCAASYACSDGTATPLLRSSKNTTVSSATEPTVEYGWSRAVTVTAFSAASTRLGSAESTLDGHTLQAIVTDATVRVRGDDNACSTCHAWATTESRATFCERVPAFLALPTASGSTSDALSAKPLVLKDLLDRWYAAGCPD